MNELTKADTIPAEYRDIVTITAEIRILQAEAREKAVEYGIKIGQRLNEAKGLVPHGEWSNWLENEVHFSQRTAERFMKLYEESDTIAKSTTLSNLSISNALRLLSVPEEDREEILQNEDVENMTHRELDAVIRERDEAKKKAEELERDNAKLRSSNTELNKVATEAKDALNKSEAKVADLEKEVDLDPNRIEQIRAEVAEEEKNKAEQRITEAEALAKKARAEANTLRKQLLASDKTSAAYSVYFMECQQNLQNMERLWNEKKNNDPEGAESLRKAAVTILSEWMNRFQ